MPRRPSLADYQGRKNVEAAGRRLSGANHTSHIEGQQAPTRHAYEGIAGQCATLERSPLLSDYSKLMRRLIELVTSLRTSARRPCGRPQGQLGITRITQHARTGARPSLIWRRHSLVFHCAARAHPWARDSIGVYGGVQARGTKHLLLERGAHEREAGCAADGRAIDRRDTGRPDFGCAADSMDTADAEMPGHVRW